jgi:hypothetical protein
MTKVIDRFEDLAQAVDHLDALYEKLLASARDYEEWGPLSKCAQHARLYEAALEAGQQVLNSLKQLKGDMRRPGFYLEPEERDYIAPLMRRSMALLNMMGDRADELKARTHGR